MSPRPAPSQSETERAFADASERVAALGETEQETALRRSILIHCGNQDAMTMGARVHLAKMRDRASVGLARCCEPARPLLLQVSAIAAVWVYAPADFRQLSRVGAAVSLTLLAAVEIERALGSPQLEVV